MRERAPLHPSQAGFTQARSTLHNIDELAQTLKEARGLAIEERKRTKKVEERNRVYVCFLDLRRAFDSVDRNKLLHILAKRGHSSNLVATLGDFLQNTVINYSNHRIGTNVGVPQGAVTSPTLFNIYIDSLVSELSRTTLRTLAFADDIVFVAKGEVELNSAIAVVENWSSNSGIYLNRSKSAVLLIRADRRTRLKAN